MYMRYRLHLSHHRLRPSALLPSPSSHAHALTFAAPTRSPAWCPMARCACTCDLPPAPLAPLQPHRSVHQCMAATSSAAAPATAHRRLVASGRRWCCTQACRSCPVNSRAARRLCWTSTPSSRRDKLVTELRSRPATRRSTWTISSSACASTIRMTRRL